MRDGAWAVVLGVGVVEGGWGVAGRDGDGDGDGRMVGSCGCRSVGVFRRGGARGRREG